MKRNHSLHFFLYVCCFLGFVGGFLPHCAPPDGTCTSSLECPGSKSCIDGKCKATQVRPSEKPTPDTSKEPNSNESSKEPVSPEKTENPSSVEVRVEPQKELQPEDGGTTKESLSEQTPEPHFECSNGATRPCTHGCGEAQQVCTDGKWGTCTPKITKRSCFDGDSTLQGIGICKSGTQTCIQEKWGPCTDQVLPTKEVCGDGKDNDCNGHVDEKSAGCQCKLGQSQACGDDTGECQKGKQHCTSQGQWGPCSGGVTPTTELCNGKDDDCNGKIDETFPTKGNKCHAGKGICINLGTFVCATDQKSVQCNARPGISQKEECNGKDDDCDGRVDDIAKKSCYPSGRSGCSYIQGKYVCKGICHAGVRSCIGGAWSRCTQYTVAGREKCRDQKDNDCDGQIDEICGPMWPYLTVSSKGSVQSYRNFFGIKPSVLRMGVGTYKIKGFNTKRNCTTHPLFIQPYGSGQRPWSVSCNNYDYIVRIGASKTTIGTLEDTSFSAIMLQQSKGNAWGLVNGTKCSRISPYACKDHILYDKTAQIRRLKTGSYILTHPLCTGPTRPYFVQMLGDSVGGYATISYYKPGQCTIRTFDLKGITRDSSFAYWLPDSKSFAWLRLKSTGGIADYHVPGKGSFSNWTVKMGTLNQFVSIFYSGYAQPSAVMTSSHTSSPHITAVSVTSSTSNELKVTPHAVGKGRFMHEFSILLVQ